MNRAFQPRNLASYHYKWGKFITVLWCKWIQHPSSMNKRIHEDWEWDLVYLLSGISESSINHLSLSSTFTGNKFNISHLLHLKSKGEAQHIRLFSLVKLNCAFCWLSLVKLIWSTIQHLLIIIHWCKWDFTWRILNTIHK